MKISKLLLLLQVLYLAIPGESKPLASGWNAAELNRYKDGFMFVMFRNGQDGVLVSGWQTNNTGAFKAENPLWVHKTGMKSGAFGPVWTRDREGCVWLAGKKGASIRVERLCYHDRLETRAWNVVKQYSDFLNQGDFIVTKIRVTPDSIYLAGEFHYSANELIGDGHVIRVSIKDGDITDFYYAPLMENQALNPVEWRITDVLPNGIFRPAVIGQILSTEGTNKMFTTLSKGSERMRVVMGNGGVATGLRRYKKGVEFVVEQPFFRCNPALYLVRSVNGHSVVKAKFEDIPKGYKWKTLWAGWVNQAQGWVVLIGKSIRTKRRVSMYGTVRVDFDKGKSALHLKRASQPFTGFTNPLLYENKVFIGVSNNRLKRIIRLDFNRE